MRALTLMLCFAWLGLWAQPIPSTNLVLDGSFEDTIKCPRMYDFLFQNTLVYWSNSLGLSGSTQHQCNLGCRGVPQNCNGFEYPHSGSAYGAIITYLPPSSTNGYHTWAIGQLSETLELNKRYRVILYVSLADSLLYACHNFGVYFSDTLPILVAPDGGQSLNLTHPVNVNFHQDLKNKVGWTKLDTTFIATGNEHWITIGNFLSDAQSDAEYVGGNSPMTHSTWTDQWGTYYLYQPWSYAVYYIDDVSVVLDDDTGLEGTGAGQVSVYPNPNTGSFVLRLAQPGPAWVELSTLAGQVVWAEQVQDNQELTPTPALSKGFYMVKVMRQGRVLHVGKMVVQ